ncbi:S41 family peptidase [Streptomyces sp. NPDC005133]
MTGSFYLRYPHVRHELVTFVAVDHVWTVPVRGGMARRLTVDPAPAAHPRISPDGTSLAWTSTPLGQRDIYLGQIGNDEIRRLTHWAHRTTRMRGWTPEGEILAITAAHQPFSRHTWAHRLPPSGGAGIRLPYGPVTDLDVGVGAVVLLTSAVGGEQAFWKGYRGGTRGRLWASVAGETFTQIHADIQGSVACPMIVGDRIAFLSDHEGTANLYACELDGSGLHRLTDHTGFYARNAATDGRRIVYQRAGEIWLLDGLDAAPQRIEVELPTYPEPRSVFSFAGDSFAGNRSGDAAVVGAGGTVQWLTFDPPSTRVLSAEVGSRVRQPVPAGDRRVVWAADDEDRDQALFLADPTAPEPIATRIATEIGRVAQLAASPDGASAAIATEDGRVLHVSLDSGQVMQLDVGDGPASGLCFSPDSARLAWSHRADVGLRSIYTTHLRDQRIVEVTDARFADTNPVFTMDGRHLAFLSRPSDAPVDALHAPMPSRPHLVSLAGGDIQVLPVAESEYSGLRAVSQGLAWLRDGSLEVFDLKELRPMPIAAGVDWFEASGDGSVLLFGKQGKMFRRSANPGREAEREVDLSRIVVEEDRAAVWRQAWAEAGRIVRHDFWDPRLPGIDWEDKVGWYRPLLERVRTADEFADLLADLLGELGTSHTYVWGPDSYGWGPPNDGPGLLGADLVQEHRPNGPWCISRIIPGDRVDELARSPLTEHLGSGEIAREGDRVVAIDGRSVEPAWGPWPLLSGCAEKPVKLTLAGASADDLREVVVFPLSDDKRLRYQDWVRRRRAEVHRGSNGRIGYVHIPDMLPSGWAQFSRDARREMRCDGLIIDVRWNRGGYASQAILDRLSRRLIGQYHPRIGQPYTYPEAIPRGPIVLCVDENTGSDAEMFAAAVQGLNLGPVVGARTWGGTVSFGEVHQLLDGTRITVPTLGLRFEQHGWAVENRGIVPDVEVLIGPDDWARGRDPQIACALQTAMELLDV